MITSYKHRDLSAIMERLYPLGQWSVKDSEIIAVPNGFKMPTEEEMEDVLSSLKADTIAKAAREATRSTLRAQWDKLDPYIRGPYRPLFDAANRLLDENDDDAAIEMIDSAEPTLKISEDPIKLATFNYVKTQFMGAIKSL